MAAESLQEGSSYSLITEPENNENRQVYFVKLTDSCLKAIEEFIHELKLGSRTKSIIRFDEAQNGKITIPGRNASAECEKKFRFSISNLLNMENNPLPECIKQSSWNSDKLLSFGPLEQKISVAATEDCYENTRNRMAQVDQERKDVRTKEIKFAGKGFKKKNVVPDTHHKPLNVKNVKKINTQSKTNTHSPKPAVTSSTNHTSSANLSKRSPVPSSRKTSSPTASSSTNSNSPLVNGITFTCKQRVIHVLGLRSHKKTELIARLQREAMSQKDRNNLEMVLRNVASHSDNHYLLLPRCYADIQVDTWPFYTESEKATVKKNMAANIIKKTDATSPPVVSSTSKSPEEKVLKRTPDVIHDHINKKQKIETSEEPSSTSVSPPKTSHNELKNINKTSHTEHKTINKTSHNEHKSINKASHNEHKTINPPNGIKSQENDPQGDESPPTVASTSDSPEYLSTYKPITSRDQRLQYKRDFQLEYPEYIELKSNLDAITTKFIELDKSLKQTEKGSPEYLEIQDEIMKAYNKQLKDEKYHTMKSRCEELHQKLGHIKRLVMDYDNQMVNS